EGIARDASLPQALADAHPGVRVVLPGADPGPGGDVVEAALEGIVAAAGPDVPGRVVAHVAAVVLVPVAGRARAGCRDRLGRADGAVHEGAPRAGSQAGEQDACQGPPAVRGTGRKRSSHG